MTKLTIDQNIKSKVWECKFCTTQEQFTLRTLLTQNHCKVLLNLSPKSELEILDIWFLESATGLLSFNVVWTVLGLFIYSKEDWMKIWNLSTTSCTIISV